MKPARQPEKATAAATVGAPGRRHFHTFDALRFFAFLKVFLHHLPIVAFPWFNYWRAGGGIGVQFFFVLSGFLITYIICEEKARRGRLDLKRFFARRALRIWPLYYLMVGVAAGTPWLLAHLHLPATGAGYEPRWWMSLLFLENYRIISTGQLPNVSPLGVMWSLCVEEHFYLLWGLVLAVTARRRLPIILLLAGLLGPVSRLVFYQRGWATADILTNLDLFAYGALPAYLLSRYPNWLTARIVALPYGATVAFVAVLGAAVAVLSQVTDERAVILTTCGLGALFSGLLLLLTPTQSRWRIAGTNPLSRLGQYTYGFYLYHTLVIILCLRLYSRAGLDLARPGVAAGFAGLTFLLSLGCSALSYHFFERPFLRLKRFFR